MILLVNSPGVLRRSHSRSQAPAWECNSLWAALPSVAQEAEPKRAAFLARDKERDIF